MPDRQTDGFFNHCKKAFRRRQGMNELEKIAIAIKRDEKLRAGALAALDTFAAAISGETRHMEAKYASWRELDEAFENVKIEQLKLASLRKLFKFALSLAVHATAKKK
jgi:hypothetical protein